MSLTVPNLRWNWTGASWIMKVTTITEALATVGREVRWNGRRLPVTTVGFDGRLWLGIGQVGPRKPVARVRLPVLIGENMEVEEVTRA